MKMNIFKHSFGLWDDKIYLTKNGRKYGLWDAGCEVLLLPCEYEYLKAADSYCIVFQKDGRRGLMYDAGDIQVLFENVYDDIGIIAHRQDGLPFVWCRESGIYHIASIRGEIVLRNLPHWQAAYLDASQTRVMRYAWSNYCVWSTDYKACRSPLNLLIDELHYPLQFTSLEDVVSLGAEVSSSQSLSSMSSQATTDWIIAGWYHLVRRLDELARLFELEYNFAALQDVDNLGCCNKDERVICLHPRLLRQPVNAIHSVLIRELCHLKCRYRGASFNRRYARYVELATHAGFDVCENCFVDYGQPFPKVDIDTIINKTLCDLYDNLTDERRKCLPLQKIPL